MIVQHRKLLEILYVVRFFSTLQIRRKSVLLTVFLHLTDREKKCTLLPTSVFFLILWMRRKTEPLTVFLHLMDGERVPVCSSLLLQGGEKQWGYTLHSLHYGGNVITYPALLPIIEGEKFKEFCHHALLVPNMRRFIPCKLHA